MRQLYLAKTINASFQILSIHNLPFALHSMLVVWDTNSIVKWPTKDPRHLCVQYTYELISGAILRNLIDKLSIFAVMSFCPQMKLIRKFGLREPIKWSGIFPLQYALRNVMVIRINWYSREGPGCRIAGQVGRFVPFASFYRYTTAYGTCWLGVIFAQCTEACCSHVFFLVQYWLVAWLIIISR